MKISIGSDHRGREQRNVLAGIIEDLGHEVVDQGTFSEQSADYPDFAAAVGHAVADGDSDLGILVCGTGIGMSIAANKIHGVRAALVTDVEDARLSRQHNHANVLCLAGNGYSPEHYRELVTAWLTSDFEGGRHARRVEKINDLDSDG